MKLENYYEPSCITTIELLSQVYSEFVEGHFCTVGMLFNFFCVSRRDTRWIEKNSIMYRRSMERIVL